MKHAAKLPSSRGGASSSPSLPSAAHTHRLSHAIAKEAPAPRKIKIVHLLEPEVINAEARHFRDLVQLLTGKKPPPTRKGLAAACVSSASSASTAGGGDVASSSSSPPPSFSSCDTAGTEYEGLGLGGGGGGGGGGAAAVGIEMMKGKEEVEVEVEGGFLRALEVGGGDRENGFYPGLEDFLFNGDIDMDRGVVGGAGFDF